MPSKRHKKSSDLFHAACELAPDARAAFLKEACAGDTKLRVEVEALLAQDEKHPSFLETAALDTNLATSKRKGRAATTVGSDSARHPQRIGCYKILDVLGEGGMGIVYLAEQTEPVRRRVALKLIKLGMDTKQVLARLESERQALAMMNHPNVAKLLDAGASEPAIGGRPYFVMEHVHGVPITDYCDRHRLSTAERLDLFMQVCQAVQHAHQKGIIHRDIKPSNVLVAVEGNKPVPKVIDFGVAKATQQKLTDRTLFTEQGQLIGTPEYMSPEQAEMTALDIDTRTDIYSLGVLLYELLVGALPFDSTSLRQAAFGEIQRIIREVDPPKPSTRLSSLGDESTTAAQKRHTDRRSLERQLRGDLDWVTMKAIEKDRTRRYNTASEFADDIARYLRHEPVLASPPSSTYRMKKFLRRNKGPVAAALTIIVLLVGGFVSSLSLYLKADEARAAEAEQRKLAELQRDRALHAERKARRQAYIAHMSLAQQAWKGADVGRLLELLNEERPMPDEEDLRGFEWYYLWKLCHSEQFTWHAPEQWIPAVAFSPNGDTLAFVSAASTDDNTVTLLDVATWQVRAVLTGHRNWINCMAYAPNGRTIATGSADGTVKFWDAAAGTQRSAVDAPGVPINAIAFSPDGMMLAVASGLPEQPCDVKMLDVATGQKRDTLARHDNPITSLAFAPNGRTLATASPHERVTIWDIMTGEERASVSANPGPSSINLLEFSPDGHTLALAAAGYPGATKKIVLWDVAAKRERVTLKGHTSYLNGLAFSPDSKTLATVSSDRIVKVWDCATGEEKLTLKGHTAGIRSVAFAPDGKTLATGGLDETVRVWDLAAGNQQPVWEGHKYGVDQVAFSLDGKTLATGGADNSVRVWDVPTGQVRTLIESNADTAPERDTGKGFSASYVSSLAFSPDGKILGTATIYHPLEWHGYQFVSTGAEGEIKLWDLASGQERIDLSHITDPIASVAFSPDGKTLAMALRQPSDRRGVWLLDVASGQLRKPLEGPRSRITAAVFAPDGMTLAAGYVDGIVRLWDLVTNRVSLEFDSGNWLESVAFSPDGRTLAATCSDGGLKLWDTMTGHEQATLESPHNPIRCMAFSPDGKTLAFGSRDGGMVKLWDVHMGRIRATLEEHTDSVAALTFSSDGSMLASAGDDMTVRIWRAATAHETEDHVDVARLLLEEAELLKDAGDNEEAQPLYRGALAMYQRLRGRDDIWTARAMQCLGAVLAKRNDPARYAEADSLLSAAAGIFEVQLAPAHEWRWETLVACDALYGPGGTNQTAKLLTMGRRLVQPGQLNRSSRNRLTSPARISGVTSPEYHRALLEAKFACRLAPNNGSYLNTLGIAHFRVGDHESALATLTRADQINSASADGGMPADVAFIAMSLHQLDRTGEAQEMLDRLRTLMKKHGTNAEAQAFLNEAERVIAGTPASNNAEQ